MSPRPPFPVAGVDGCRGGWLVVCIGRGGTGTARAELVRDFAAVLEVTADAAAVAIDIPIGLPERGSIGGRACDAAARANLGTRQSSVFAVPARAAVEQINYVDACLVSLAASAPPRRVSKQTYNLFPKIREVDALMSPALQARVIECHPEAAFWAMNGERPLDLPKKVKSRPYPPGLALRRALLEAQGFDGRLLAAVPWRSADAGADDLLDAAACAWSAARIAAGVARRFPAAPQFDAKGLRMEIWA